MTRDEFIKKLKNDIVNYLNEAINGYNKNHPGKEQYPTPEDALLGLYLFKYNNKSYNIFIKVEEFPLSEEFVNNLCEKVCTCGDETGDYDKYELQQ